MSRVPREEFVPSHLIDHAYGNVPLPIGDGQTISQPLIVAEMTSALRLKSTDRVLEVGTGSGYQAAILSLLVSEVITVELIPSLADEARTRLAALGYDNVRVLQASEDLGWPAEAPYDAVMVTAGAPEVPITLVDQLVIGRNMIVPVGPLGEQDLLLVTRLEDGHGIRSLGRCAFVPLIGRDAWLPETRS